MLCYRLEEQNFPSLIALEGWHAHGPAKIMDEAVDWYFRFSSLSSTLFSLRSLYVLLIFLRFFK